MRAAGRETGLQARFPDGFMNSDGKLEGLGPCRPPAVCVQWVNQKWGPHMEDSGSVQASASQVLLMTGWI